MESEEEYTAELDDELQGALLSANERIRNAGGNLVIISMMLGVVISIALHTHWMDRLTGLSFAELRHW